MALIKCTGCGQQISTRAKLCPKCGYGSEARSGNAGSAPEVSPVDSEAAADAASFNNQRLNGIDRADQEQGVESQEESAQNQADGVAIPKGSAENQEQAAADRPDEAEEWYYVTSSGRNGPVTLASLREFAATGQIDEQTKVWKTGMPDWVALAQYQGAEVDAVPPEPPAIAVTSSPSRYIWALALAPIWGTILQIIVTESWVALTGEQLGYYSQLWWIMIIACFLAAYLDLMSLKKAGQDVSKINKWMPLLAPAYIYLRDRKFHAHLVRLWVWTGSLLLSLAAYLHLNDIYARLLIR